ncbi:hypothetical protein K458DRAFT_275767, partial [Lentithecium fluviatile CBS 122367]
GCLVLINGYPAAGKLAIARALYAEVPRSSEKRLVDHHLLIDAAHAIAPDHDNRLHQIVRKDLRTAAFMGSRREFGKNKKGDLTVIMTTCIAHIRSDLAILLEYFNIARGTKIRVLYINLKCRLKEHTQRILTEDRYHQGRMKLRDETKMHELLAKYRLADCTMIRGVAVGLRLRVAELDTTYLSV